MHVRRKGTGDQTNVKLQRDKKEVPHTAKKFYCFDKISSQSAFLGHMHSICLSAAIFYVTAIDRMSGETEDVY